MQEAFALYRAHGFPQAAAFRAAGYSDRSRGANRNAGKLEASERVSARMAWLLKPENRDEARALFENLLAGRRGKGEVEHRSLEAILALVTTDAASTMEPLSATLADPVTVRTALDLHRAAVTAREDHLEGLRLADQHEDESERMDGAKKAHAAVNRMREALGEPLAPFPFAADPRTIEVSVTERDLRQNLAWGLAEYEVAKARSSNVRNRLKVLDSILRTLVKLAKLVSQRAGEWRLRAEPPRSALDIGILTRFLELVKHEVAAHSAQP